MVIKINTNKLISCNGTSLSIVCCVNRQVQIQMTRQQYQQQQITHTHQRLSTYW